MRISDDQRTGLSGAGLRFAIIVSRFNSRVTHKLLEGALKGLKECQTEDKNILVIEVPGAFEISQAALLISKYKKVDAIICLGAVIKGETPHFEYICSQTSQGIMSVGLKTGIPLLFGVLTVNNLTQALKRTRGKENKGREAALSAVEMAQLFKRIKKK